MRKMIDSMIENKYKSPFVLFSKNPIDISLYSEISKNCISKLIDETTVVLIEQSKYDEFKQGIKLEIE
jgi:hypothetical protein